MPSDVAVAGVISKKSLRPAAAVVLLVISSVRNSNCRCHDSCGGFPFKIDPHDTMTQGGREGAGVGGGQRGGGRKGERGEEKKRLSKLFMPWGFNFG